MPVFRFFCTDIVVCPVPYSPYRTASPAAGIRCAGRAVGACALYGHFCKIDRIGASSRQLLHVIGTYSFI